MTTARSFVSIPLDDRDVSELDAQLREHAGAGAGVVGEAARDGDRLATVSFPRDPDRSAQVLDIVAAWIERTTP